MADMIDNSAAFFDSLEQKAASSLLKAGQILCSAYLVNTSKSFPPASTPGQFPRRRTGDGSTAATWRPTSVGAVRNNGFEVVVGLLKPGIHMAWLELQFNRLGFSETLKQNADRIGQTISVSQL